MIRTTLLAALLVMGTGCAARKQLGDMTTRAESCEARLSAAQGKITALEGELAGSQSARDLAEKRLAAYRDLAARLRGAYGTDLEIEVRNGRMVVKLPNSILFDTGEARLKPEGKLSLKKLSTVLKGEERNFQVAGHTDNAPVTGKSSEFKTNWELSTQRALAAVYYLETAGVPDRRLAAVGYGEHQPVAENDSPATMAQNRRTEIVIMPKLDEIPSFPKDL